MSMIPFPNLPTALRQFAPKAPTSTLAVGTVSSYVKIGDVGDTILLTNDGTVTAFVEFGNDTTVIAAAGGSVTATTYGSMPVLAGTVQIFNATSMAYVAGITASGTTTLRITRGSGL